MRQITLIILLLSSLLFNTNAAHAGILVKKHTTVTEASNKTTNNHATERMARLKSVLVGGRQHECDKEGENCNCSCHKREHKNRCGSAGTTGMWLSILGWFYCPPLLIAGIAYGAHGMRPGACKQNRALAGVIIGTAGIFFWTLIIVAATLW
jgi:hypothetical protein